MKNLAGLVSVGFGGLFLASCVTYPYETGFTSCEREANACYRLCEDIPDEGGYVACQSHCDRDIDRCFDQAYSPYSNSYYYGSYGYPSPWYGRYGSWYPNSGYYLSFNYYDRYGYRKKRHHPNEWRDGRGGRDWRDNRSGRDWREDRDRNPPTGSTPPPNTDGAGPRPSDGNPRGGPRRQRDGERLIDRPQRPNRYYRRNSTPSNAGATPSPSTSPALAPRPAYTPPPSSPPTYSRPPRQPRPSAPPPSAQPSAPPSQPAAAPPPSNPSSAPPRSRPARSDDANRGGRRGDEPVDRDRD